MSEGGLLGGGVSIDELVLADQPERWSALGFLVRDGVCQLGSVRVRLAEDGPRGPQKGILSWSLRGLRGQSGPQHLPWAEQLWRGYVYD